MDAAGYVAWLHGAVSTQLVPDGPQAWHVRDRGALGTLRLDGAVAWAFDAASSQGTIGAWRVGSALYVALDPATDTPFVVLTPRRDAAVTLGPHMIGLVEAGPVLSDMRRRGCRTTFTAIGPGRVTVRAANAPEVDVDAAPLPVTSPEDGVWRVFLPGGETSAKLSFAVGCG